MVVVRLTMKALPEKRKELVQTLLGMIEPSRKVKGCISHHLYQNLEDDNLFILIEEWRSQEDLDAGLRSDQFHALLGAMNLLSEAADIKFSTVSSTAGMEVVEAATGRRLDS
jgi:quinol monooxygenase YgiN